MPTVEQRIAYLEGRMGEHTRQIDGVREALGSLEARMDRRFDAVDRRCERMEQRLDHTDARMSRQFLWLVGIQITTLASILAAFSALALRS